MAENDPANAGGETDEIGPPGQVGGTYAERDESQAARRSLIRDGDDDDQREQNPQPGVAPDQPQDADDAAAARKLDF